MEGLRQFAVLRTALTEMSRRRCADDTPAGEPMAKRLNREGVPSPDPRAILVSCQPKETSGWMEPLSLSSKLDSDMVDLYVGPNRKHFHVHKKIICESVPILDKMFNGDFKEAREGTAEFPDDCALAFDQLLDWCYVKKLDGILTTKATMATHENPFVLRIKTYCLADKYCLEELMDRSMDTIIRAVIAYPAPLLLRKDFQRYIYDNTPEGSPLRLLLRNLLYHQIMTIPVTIQGSFNLDNPSIEHPGLVKDLFKYMQLQHTLPVRSGHQCISRNIGCAFHCHTAKGILGCPYKPEQIKLFDSLSANATKILLFFKTQWYWSHQEGPVVRSLHTSWIIRVSGLSFREMTLALAELHGRKLITLSNLAGEPYAQLVSALPCVF